MYVLILFLVHAENSAHLVLIQSYTISSHQLCFGCIMNLLLVHTFSTKVDSVIALSSLVEWVFDETL